MITQNPTIDVQNEQFPAILYVDDGAAIFACVGDPTGIINANRGSLALDITTGNVYKKTANGTSGWSNISGGGGGGVSSVGLTAPAFFTVSGSPVTSSGIIALAIDDKLANLILASPASGTGQPTFRSLVIADIPSLVDGVTGSVQYNNGGGLFEGNNRIRIDSATGTLRIGNTGSGDKGLIQLFTGGGSNTLTIRGGATTPQTWDTPSSLPTVGQVLAAISVAGSVVGLGFVSPSSPAGGSGDYQLNNAGTFGAGNITQSGGDILVNGGLYPATDNTQKLGSVSSPLKRWASGYIISLTTDGLTTGSYSQVSGNMSLQNATVIIFGSQTQLVNSGDGIFTMRNSAQTSFGRLTFGPASSAHPALKREDGSTLRARLADDSADAVIMSNAAPLFEGKLITVTGVNLNTITKTGLLTVPSGKTLFITKIIVRNVSTSLTLASFGFGFNASADDVISSATHTELTGNTLYTTLKPKDGAAIGNAADTFGVKCSITQGATATATMDVYGYYL